MAKKPYRYAVLEALAQEMRKDPNLCYFYEYQSPVATDMEGRILNLWREFGDVRTSAQGWPLDETWYVGCATGMATAGIPVVVELPSMCQVFALEFIFNQVGNFRMMTGGQLNMPVVIWLDGAGRARGSAQQHTQVGHEALYANIPGLQVVVPSNAYDAAGLMRAAVRSPDPVIFCDYREMSSGEQPDVPDEEFVVEIGKAAVRQEGTDLTLVSWAPATGDVAKAIPDIEKEGISVEYIDLRTIRPMDTETLINSVKKTKKLLVVEHGYWSNGFSATVLATAAQFVPEARVARITFPDAAGPAAEEMIMWMRPDAPKIVDAAKQMAAL